MRYDYVFWDWNGTVYDDAEASKDAVNLMLRRRGKPDIDLETYREYIDIPISKFYEKAFGSPLQDMDLLASEFNADYRACLPECPLRAGIKEVIERLYSLGIRQCVFSSSANEIINEFLDKHGMAQYFDAVLGASDYYVGSKLQRTKDYLENNGIDPKRAVFIGDMEHDYEVASACGSDCIHIGGGHRPDKVLENTGRPFVCDAYGLLELITK